MVEFIPESLGEPEHGARQNSEDHACDDHIVEVGNKEQTVVEHEVGGRHGEKNTGQTADHERE